MGRVRKRRRPSISIDIYCFNFGFDLFDVMIVFYQGGKISEISEIIKEILLFGWGLGLGLCLFCGFIVIGFLFGR